MAKMIISLPMLTLRSLILREEGGLHHYVYSLGMFPISLLSVVVFWCIIKSMSLLPTYFVTS